MEATVAYEMERYSRTPTLSIFRRNGYSEIANPDGLSPLEAMWLVQRPQHVAMGDATNETLRETRTRQRRLTQKRLGYLQIAMSAQKFGEPTPDAK